MRPEQLDRLNACVEDWRAHKDTDATEMFDDYDMECLIALLSEVKRLRTLANRLAVGLIDANRLDYPWKDGSRASKALDEAEALRDVEK